ncbi:MAG: enoyl-CoA hydratase/isomerase family protein, partial [Sphingomonadales bacterium]|nr:enoyl-CoA hydratase/isomerase family protein [Sphingomonadales bacterium]
MRWAEHLVDARRLWAGEAAWSGPLALIDLARAPEPAAPLVLPPCPVIGFGDGAHPLARQLDAVVEPPVSLDRLAESILGAPRAAAVLVELLRHTAGLEVGAALFAESLAYGLLQGSAEHGAWLARRAPGAARPPGRLCLRREADRLVIALDRPAAGNAIDRALRDALAEAFGMAALDREIAQVVLCARGRAFSLGGELAEFGTTRDPADAHAIRRRTLPALAIARCAARLEARIGGACVGAGLEMAAFARRCVATPASWFQLPELAMGLIPGAGGCVSLARRIGRQRTAL